MPKSRFASGADVLGYKLPAFHDSKTAPYVDIYAFDPISGSLKRKKYHIPAKISKKEKRERARELIAALTAKLRSGWSPWMEVSEGANAIIAIEVALNRYTLAIEKSSRKKTIQAYTSRVKILREYIAQMPVPVRYTYQLNKAFVCGFLDYIYLDRECGARTRNNYLGWFGGFCSFCIERGMMSANPTAGIKKIAEAPKKRQPLTEEMVRELSAYLAKTDRHYQLACLTLYYMMIRPSELSRIKVGDVHVMQRQIFIAAEISKNKRDGFVGIPQTLLNLMLDLRVLEAPSNWYLFGTNFRPSPNKLHPDAFNKRWHKVRDALGWSDDYQYYSLKDSGIRDLSNNAGVVTARDQARHTDISTTNKYLQGRQTEVPSAILNFSGALTPSDDKTRP